MFRFIGSFGKSRVREIGGEIIELEGGKCKGNKVWFEISGGSGNRGFEKSGFHCIAITIFIIIIIIAIIIILVSSFQE